VQPVFSFLRILYIITAKPAFRPKDSIFAIKLAIHAFETDYPFCSNLRCALHVRADDTTVHGVGNWARMPDERMIGRGLYNGIFLCDPCGRAEIGTAVQIQTEAAA
jgi:hypothetical protein